MSETIEQKCLAKGVKLTDQRRIIAKVMSESSDHPDVDELYNRVSKIDSKISIATVYRTVKLFEESGILTKHEFKGGKARYEELNEGHHDHLIDVKTGEIIEFVDNEIESLQKKVASTAGLDRIILSIFFSKSIVRPTATAKNVFPVPAGPAEIIISLCLNALTYSFCFSDLGIIDFFGVLIISVTLVFLTFSFIIN